METIYVPSKGVDDWCSFLADSKKQWRTGFSAKTLAYCWEEANGFPQEVAQVFKDSNLEVFKDITLLMAIPEHKVPLPPMAIAPSQNDIFVLAKAQNKLISITIEGKVSEPFGEALNKWNINPSSGKIERFNFLKEQLGLLGELPQNIRYQLLHRTVSAILEAKRFTSKTAVMLIHSFSQEMEWFEDYQIFLQLFNVTAVPNNLQFVKQTQGIDLYCGWVKGNTKYLKV